MQAIFWVWIAVIIISIIVEATTMELVSVWFAIGAIIPAILSATDLTGWIVQLIIFFIVSVTLMLSLRKLTLKFLNKNSESKTNKDSLIGLKVKMLEMTDIETVGSVKINDIVWSAIGDKNQTIEKGKFVEIVAIAGNKLKVKEIKNPQNNISENHNNN